MRQFFSSLTILFVLALSTLSALAQQKSYSCRYFSIKYPQAWTTVVVGNPNSSGTALTDASINIKPMRAELGEPKHNITINMDPSINWSSFGQNELRQFKSMITSQYSEVVFIIDPKYVTYKGLDGIYMEYTTLIAGYRARMIQCIIHKLNGFTFVITLGVDDNKAASQLEEINDIMDTMVIK